MTATRAEIVAAALSWRGVPFRHQGRARDGVDCVGLVLAVGRQCGVDTRHVDVPDYGRLPDGRFFGLFARHLTRITRDAARAGSVIVFARGAQHCHAGILIDDLGSYLHASVRRGCVTFGTLRKPAHTLRAVVAFDLPGVVDG